MSIEITFDKPSAAYLPGEVVKGTAILTLDKELLAGAIHFLLIGKVRTHWIVIIRYPKMPHESHIPPHVNHYEDNVDVVRMRSTVWKADGGKQPLLKAGKHELPFSFILPSDAPPSFIGSDGEIFYELKMEFGRRVQIDAPSRNIRVLPLLDLNAIPMAAAPILLEKDKKLGLPLISKDKITVNVCLPKTGFASGELMAVQLNVHNESSNRIIKGKVQLYRRITFEAYSGERKKTFKRKEMLVEATTALSIEPTRRSKVLLGVMTPHTVPSLEKDHVVVQYYLKAILKTNSLLKTAIKITVPIIIGTVALDASSAQKGPRDASFSFANRGYVGTPAVVPSSSF